MRERRRLSILSSRLTSTVSVSLVLLLLGMVVMMGVVAQRLSVLVRENIAFSLVMSDGATSDEILSLRKDIQESAYAREVRYISKAEALKELTEELGDDPTKFLGFNPLLPSIEVKMHAEYAHPDSVAVIEKELKGHVFVRDFTYRKEMLELVSENIRKITTVLSVVAVLLLVISMSLMNNTIRLWVYSKRFLIYTMRLVGATDWFIQRPFVMALVGNGILAAMLANAMLYGLVRWLVEAVEGASFMLNGGTLAVVFGAVLFLGITISFVATMLSIRRFLRMPHEQLFKV